MSSIDQHRLIYKITTFSMVGELAMMQMVNPWNMWMWFWMDALNVMVICFQKEAGRVVHDAMKRTNGVSL